MWEQDRSTKTGARDDTVLIDSASFAGVCEALGAHIRDAKSRREKFLFFKVDYVTFARILREGAGAVGLPFDVTPRMTRHGGASEMVHRKLRSLERVQSRGHWRQLGRVQRYEKSGRLLVIA